MAATWNVAVPAAKTVWLKVWTVTIVAVTGVLIVVPEALVATSLYVPAIVGSAEAME